MAAALEEEIAEAVAPAGELSVVGLPVGVLPGEQLEGFVVVLWAVLREALVEAGPAEPQAAAVELRIMAQVQYMCYLCTRILQDNLQFRTLQCYRLPHNDRDHLSRTSRSIVCESSPCNFEMIYTLRNQTVLVSITQ